MLGVPGAASSLHAPHWLVYVQPSSGPGHDFAGDSSTCNAARTSARRIHDAMSKSSVPGTSSRTTALGPYRVRSFIHALRHVCEKPSEVARRNRRCAATHSGGSIAASSDRKDPEPSKGSKTRGRVASPFHPSRVFTRVPRVRPLGWPYRTEHLFHSVSKSSSGTKPYL